MAEIIFLAAFSRPQNNHFVCDDMLLAIKSQPN